MTASEGDGRGRRATSPLRVPGGGWKDVAWRVKTEVRRDKVPLLSAGVAFYMLLALFPALLALVSVYALISDPADVERQVQDISSALPAGAQDLITSQLESIVQEAGGSLTFGLLVGVLVALWAVSSGAKHLIAAVNTAYDEEETRGFLALRGMSLALSVLGILLAVLAIAVIALVPAVVDDMELGGTAGAVTRWIPYAVLALGFAVALAVLYRVAPNREPARWRWITPGAVLGTILWIAGSVAFSVYVTNFGSYNETYGSIGAVIVLMLWLVLTAFSVILGAEVNAEIEEQTAVEPLDERGAVRTEELGALADQLRT